MKLKLDITDADGIVDRVTVRPRTQVAYERHFKTRLDDTLGNEGLYWMAWHALGTNKKFDEWLDAVDSVDPVEDDAEVSDTPDPLAPTPSSGASLPSPSNPAQASPSTP